MKKITLILSAIAFAASCLHAEFELNDSMKQQLMDACPAKAAAKPQKPRKILFFSKTAGFRHHDGIAAERFAYQNMGDKLGIFEVVTSEDTADVEPDKLKQYDAIIMCSTTGKIFGDDSERILKGIMDYVENGGGLMTIHGGVDCYNYDPFRRTDYTSMLGGEFIDHPWNYGERSTMVIDDTQSPITKGIWNGDSFGMTDEIYMLGQTYNRDTCRVLIRLDRDRSPEKPHANPKRDIATVLIKKYGKGRKASSDRDMGARSRRRNDRILIIAIVAAALAIAALGYGYYCDVRAARMDSEYYDAQQGDVVNPDLEYIEESNE